MRTLIAVGMSQLWMSNEAILLALGYRFKGYKKDGLKSQTPLRTTLLFSGQSELRFLMDIATINRALTFSSVPILPPGTLKGVH